jgi:hypothetical protein
LLIAQLVATRVANAHPREATVERTVSARPKATVYVDYLQNVLGKSVAAAYAVRARPGATVSTPLEWGELTSKLDPRDFTIETVGERFARVGDLWASAMSERNTAATPQSAPFAARAGDDGRGLSRGRECEGNSVDGSAALDHPAPADSRPLVQESEAAALWSVSFPHARFLHCASRSRFAV